MYKKAKLLFLVLILMLFISPVCLASNEVKTPLEIVPDGNVTNSTTTPDETTETNKINILNTDVYLADVDVTISDTVNGNAFAYGQTVNVTGQIQGDAFIFGNKVTIDKFATISGNLFVYANELTVNGSVRDVYAFASNFTIGETGFITRDLKLYANTLNINGTIQRDAYVAAGAINFKSGATSLVRGNFNYTAETEAVIPEGSVLGEVKFSPVEKNVQSTQQIISSYITSFLSVLIYAIVIILIVAFIFPKFADKATYAMEKKPFVTAGIGILGTVLIPVLSIILCIIGFLSYVGLSMLAIYILILSITISILGIAIGNYFTNKFKNKTKGEFILLSSLSVAVIWALQKLPYVGSWISIFTVVFGFGIFLYSFFRTKELPTVEQNKK